MQAAGPWVGARAAPLAPPPHEARASPPVRRRPGVGPPRAPPWLAEGHSRAAGAVLAVQPHVLGAFHVVPVVPYMPAGQKRVGREVEEAGWRSACRRGVLGAGAGAGWPGAGARLGDLRKPHAIWAADPGACGLAAAPPPLAGGGAPRTKPGRCAAPGTLPAAEPAPGRTSARPSRCPLAKREPPAYLSTPGHRPQAVGALAAVMCVRVSGNVEVPQRQRGGGFGRRSSRDTRAAHAAGPSPKPDVLQTPNALKTLQAPRSPAEHWVSRARPRPRQALPAVSRAGPWGRPARLPEAACRLQGGPDSPRCARAHRRRRCRRPACCAAGSCLQLASSRPHPSTSVPGQTPQSEAA